MTMPLLKPPLGIREVDLRDARETARIAAFVRDTAGATPFHLPAWSLAVQQGTGQRARYLVAERANGGLAGVLPLTDMRSVLFGGAMVSAGFAVDGGLLGHADAELAAAAWALAERRRCGVELRGGPAPDGWEIDRESYVGFARPLAETDEAELKAIPKRQRAEVRRSDQFELETKVGADAKALRDHYRVYAESVRNLGSPVFPAALLRAVIATMDADILTVHHRGRPVSSVLSLYAGETVYPYWGGGVREARALRANDHLYFALMRHARERGFTRFDFGRSKAGSGAAAFKKNWGFAPVPLSYARRSDGVARAVNPNNPKYALMVAVWKRLPLPLATALGPWIARGLG